MKIRSGSLFYASALLLSIILLGACRPAATETQAITPTDPPASVTPGAATNTPETGPITQAPPDSTLRINDQVQVSGIGSYCWPGAADQPSICVDKIGIPTAQQPVSIDGPFQAVFTLPREEAPENAVLTVRPVADSDEMQETAQGYRWWPPLEGEQYLLPLGSTTEIDLTLDDGLYVFSLFVNWQGIGDVTYGFLVAVGPFGAPEFEVLETTVEGVVTLPDEVTFYSGPGDFYEPVATVFGGLIWPVSGVSVDGNWWQLICGDDQGQRIPECWVSADPSITAPAEPTGEGPRTLASPVDFVLTLARFGLNVRSGPDTTFDIVDVIPLGNLVEVTGVTEDEAWWRVRCPDGQIANCWISADPDLSQPAPLTKRSLSGLVFRPVDEQFQLWMVDGNGEPQLKLENFRGSVAPDGKSALSCCLSREFIDMLSLVDLETGAEVDLLPETGRFVHNPTWWPSRPGTVLFLTQNADPAGQPLGTSIGNLGIVNTDKTDYEILDETNETFAPPAASPDGETIAYNRSNNPTSPNAIFEPWLYRLDSGPEPFDYEAYGLEDLSDASFGAPAWSPDGTRLAWVIAGEIGPDDIFLLGLAIFDLESETSEVVLTYVPINDEPSSINGPGPIWSPDGEWLVWAAFPVDDPPGFWVLRPDGADFQFIPGGDGPVWSPEGDYLAFNAIGNIMLMESGVWGFERTALPSDSVVQGWAIVSP